MIRHSKDGYCISLPFVVKCSCKPPEKTTTLLPPVITTDNNLITAHRIGWIIWTHQIIKKMRYQIYEAKSVKHDAQQRMGMRYAFRKVTQSLRFSSVIPACGNDWTTVFIIHKRELSDSMIESGSSLFYLFSFFLSSATSQSLNSCDGVTF